MTPAPLPSGKGTGNGWQSDLPPVFILMKSEKGRCLQYLKVGILLGLMLIPHGPSPIKSLHRVCGDSVAFGGV